MISWQSLICHSIFLFMGKEYEPLKMTLCRPRHVSAKSLLKTLHWLPVKARIQYKIACLCFQCLCHSTMPSYLSDLHQYYLSRMLRSLDTSLLTVPRFCLETFGKRSFSVFGHCLELPTFISQENSVIFNFQKEAKNSSVRQASLLMFASVCFVYVIQMVCVCVCVWRRGGTRRLWVW